MRPENTASLFALFLIVPVAVCFISYVFFDHFRGKRLAARVESEKEKAKEINASSPAPTDLELGLIRSLRTEPEAWRRSSKHIGNCSGFLGIPVSLVETLLTNDVREIVLMSPRYWDGYGECYYEKTLLNPQVGKAFGEWIKNDDERRAEEDRIAIIENKKREEEERKKSLEKLADKLRIPPPMIGGGS